MQQGVPSPLLPRPPLHLTLPTRSPATPKWPAGFVSSSPRRLKRAARTPEFGSLFRSRRPPYLSRPRRSS